MDNDLEQIKALGEYKVHPEVSPDHYKRWKVEPLWFIMQNDLPFWLGNVLKYCMRFDAKDGLKDLKKARVYLDEKIKELENNE